jgi:Spy/CpxP family protein refolding chaperone
VRLAPALCTALLAFAAPTSAQHAGHGHGGGGHAGGRHAAGPYAGFQGREAAGLSAEEVGDLRAGRGMGFALPAELNGYPGPLHTLELAGPLGLSEAQRALFAAQIDEMRREAIPLGEAVIAAERALDAVFRRGTATAAEVDAASEAAALARGRLRAVHLRVHLATFEAMTPEQRAAYSRLRGYERHR